MCVEERKPVVFACAGCSAAGRLAYDLALELDRRQAAEMSCLAGLAAELKPFTRLVECRPVWVVDGCPIQCARAILEHQGLPINYHIRLENYGVRKTTGLPYGADLEGLADRVVGRSTLDQESSPDAADKHGSSES